MISFKDSFYSRQRYTTLDHHPFYDLVIPFLPEDRKGIIVDIGAGYGGFAEYLNLYNQYSNIYLLDANNQIIKFLCNKTKNAILYRAPDRLPFEDGTVSFIHCSHIVEHLNHPELYSFLKELDRVLKNGGILVISTPLLWKWFYNDLSHVRPYHPIVFKRYLCGDFGELSSSRKCISQEFEVKKLVYRYTTNDDSEWGANNILLDFLISLFAKVQKMIGIAKYIRNGFTLVLQKDTGSLKNMQ